MEALFDTDLVIARRKRALRKPVAGADFLMRLVADELAERLAVVERRFDLAVELHGATGMTGEACMAPPRVRRRRPLPQVSMRLGVSTPPPRGNPGRAVR